jgi:hypothetical protein
MQRPFEACSKLKLPSFSLADGYRAMHKPDPEEIAFDQYYYRSLGTDKDNLEVNISQ